MKTLFELKHIADLNNFLSCTTEHPLVAVIDFSKTEQKIEDGTRICADFYSIMFKNYCSNHLRYGRQTIDFQDGNLICIAPKQVITMDSEVEQRPDQKGWGLFFHPELIRGTPLENKMPEYSFFHYEVSEALHLSDKEQLTLFECIQNIDRELKENIDIHSQGLIITNIELLLNYCSRYYGRQFITRKNTHTHVVARVEQLLHAYFGTSKAEALGLPTVKYLAENVHLSASYLSDLLKKETGRNAQDHIHYHVIEAAKRTLLHSNDSVAAIAAALGFEYPQYFSKLFKQKTGMTPLEYRSRN